MKTKRTPDELWARRARETRARYGQKVAEMKWPVLLTLDRKNLGGQLTVARLRETARAFARLRRARWWREAVRGGVASVEVSHNGDGWHDHIHAVIDSKWLPLPLLIAAWPRALRAPGTVHVTRIKDRAAAFRYITKPAALTKIEGSAAQFTDAMSATHLTTAWGTCK